MQSQSAGKFITVLTLSLIVMTVTTLSAAAAPFQLEVTSTPDNAAVFINGVYRQNTPALITLSPGVYNLRLEKKDYYPYQDEIIIKNRGIVRLHPHLDKESFYGTALINSNPPEARIFIGNRYYDITPARIRLWAGSHRIRLEKEGYQTVTRNLAVPRDTAVLADIDLKPVRRYGTVTITTDPVGCKLFINGVFQGTSPGSMRLPAGPYTLTLKKRGYEEQAHGILVKGSKSLQSSYELAKRVPPQHPQSTGTLNISSTPPYATIRVDGRTIGNTPQAVRLSPGLHTIKLSAIGFKPYLENVKVHQSTIKALNILLTPLQPVITPGILHVTANQEAGVSVDSVYRGDTPVTLRLDPGGHVLNLHREGFNPYETQVYLYAGQETNIHARLEAPRPQVQEGSIRFTSNPLGGKLMIDNQYQGTTPMGLSLKPGEHFIVIQHKGFYPYRQSIRIEPGMNPTLHADLRWKGHRSPTRVILQGEY